MLFFLLVCFFSCSPVSLCQGNSQDDLMGLFCLWFPWFDEKLYSAHFSAPYTNILLDHWSMFKDVIHFSGFLKVNIIIKTEAYIWSIDLQFSAFENIWKKKKHPKHSLSWETVDIGCFLTKCFFTQTYLCYKHTIAYNTALSVLVWVVLFQFASGLREFVLRCQQGAFHLPDQCR